MIFTLLIMFTIIALHALIIQSVVEISHPILYFLLAFNYVMLVVVAVDYFILLIVDPVDPRLLTNDYQERENDKKLLVYCTACRRNVHVYSYHCKVCKRCADEFDHHCIFLNNCIGRKNYASFFRVLLTLSMFLIINIG
jgi:palmitoyltransferase ZDHHC1/11